jgi:DMSO/TMAO reductase YedYZ molybdopterin-dependent catalytic subunit
MKTQWLCFLVAGAVILSGFAIGHGREREKLSSDTPEIIIIRMQPKDIDPSLLPLDKIEDLHRTGVPQKININTWRLAVTGVKIKYPSEFSYSELQQMPQVKKSVLLICPRIFKDYAKWEGVPLSDILKKAGVAETYHSVIIKGKDRYSKSFTRREIDENLIFLALKVNDKVLPKEHGFPLRVVAEDILGGKWVKWVTQIEVR